MRKRCRDCRSMACIEAPYCFACGAKFAYMPSVPEHAANWKGRVAAIACGLLAAAIMRALYL
jgi:hypothetical protein